MSKSLPTAETERRADPGGAGLLALRLRKAAYSLTRPGCWRALRNGVFPSVEHLAALKGLQPDLVLDVGANRGQFALLMRQISPASRIVSFEPIPAEAAVFRRVFAGDGQVSLEECALGEEEGSATLHLSGCTDSSSLLPMGLQSEYFPATGEVGTLRVSVRTLDSFRDAWAGGERALLKLDVQGFELSALRGGTEALTRCTFVYVECSEVPLYVGQALGPEVRAWLGEQGFRQRMRLNETYGESGLIQADYLFERS
jgi:FkbM family methyltransferase